MQDPISQVLQEDNIAAGNSKMRVIYYLRVRWQCAGWGGKPSGKSSGPLDVYLQKRKSPLLSTYYVKTNQFNLHDSIIVLLLKLRKLNNFLKVMRTQVMRMLKPVLSAMIYPVKRTKISKIPHKIPCCSNVQQKLIPSWATYSAFSYFQIKCMLRIRVPRIECTAQRGVQYQKTCPRNVRETLRRRWGLVGMN